MQVSLARRALFKGKFTAPLPASIRPPWSLDEASFLDACSRCDACISACGEGIIVRGDGGYPQINFKNGACTFCGTCADACEDDALAAPAHGITPNTTSWNITAHIGDGCLSANGVTCRVCGDRCDARAIRFQLAVGGVANPILDPQACTGCGACVQPCPTGVITISHMTEETVA